MAEISIIVPVYKVENYLNRCVSSILAQTFTDFELILVDDGSPDNCPAMCDTWMGRDKRVYVIHQKNVGLSAARNAGIDWTFSNSDSKWLTFIDSDDWIHPKYLEVLLQGVLKNDTEICSCDFVRTEGEILEVNESLMRASIWNTEDYFIRRNANAITAWGKLYKKKLFEEIRYPRGRIYEDGATTYRILFKVNEISVVEYPLYHYYINRDGITQAKWSIKCLDGLLNYEEQQVFFEQKQNQRLISFVNEGYKQSIAMNVVAASANRCYWQLPKKYRVGFWKAVRILQKSWGVDRYEAYVVQYYPWLVKAQAYVRKIKSMFFIQEK